MNVSSIQVLKQNVSQQEALRTFSSYGPSTMYWRIVRGPLQRVAPAYVPYRLFSVGYRLRLGERTTLFAIDTVDGSLDLFSFAQKPAHSQLVTIETRNYVQPALEDSRVEAILRDKVLRAIFQQGFFKLRDANLRFVPHSDTFYIPYWLGFYGYHSLRCRVLDAVRRRIEGAKASAFFEQWLAAGSTDGPSLRLFCR